MTTADKTPFFPFFRVCLLCAGWLALGGGVHGQAVPVVSNIQVSQRAGTKLVDITYDLAADSATVTVWIDVSNDGGRSYIVPAQTFQGHIGQGVAPGTQRAAVWNAEADFDGMLAEQMKVRINARTGEVPIPPPLMVYIPGGPFFMGPWDSGNAGASRSVHISPFFMDRYEVRAQLYHEVRGWALQNGYSMGEGGYRESAHPIHSVNWYDAVKWCNARSQREGLTPVYYTTAAHTTVYRTGDVDLTNAMVKWDANGYRLPTEAEWEKAARGGLTGKTYPWGDTINGTMANYSGSGASHPWSNTDPRTTPVGYYNGDQQGGGSDMANGYGLYDMAGNVWEWCWDRWTENPSGASNPRGPNAGDSNARLLRGGAWYNPTTYLRCASRLDPLPSFVINDFGFRCARSL